MARSGVRGSKGGNVRKPWTEAMLEHLHRTGQSGWFNLDNVLKTGMQAVPEERALRQWQTSYARFPHAEDWPQQRRIEAGARQVCQVAMLQLEKSGIVVVDPPSYGAGLVGRRAKKRVRLAPASPWDRAKPWVRAMYEELQDGAWHDMQAVVRVMMRHVPPQAAINNYRINYANQQRGTLPQRVKATTLQQKLRDGAWDLCRRSVVSAKGRGRIEIDPPGWQADIAGKKIRWLGYGSDDS